MRERQGLTKIAAGEKQRGKPRVRVAVLICLSLCTGVQTALLGVLCSGHGHPRPCMQTQRPSFCGGIQVHTCLSKYWCGEPVCVQVCACAHGHLGASVCT